MFPQNNIKNYFVLCVVVIISLLFLEFNVLSDWLKSYNKSFVVKNIETQYFKNTLILSHSKKTTKPAADLIRTRDKYWQVFESSDGSFYLYGAYLDVRKNNRLGPTVRILGMINRLEPQVKTFCQLWFSDSGEAVVSKVLEYKYIWYKKWGNYKQGLFQPYLLACQLPKTHWGKTPVSVSVVEQKCDNATNNLKVTYNKPEEGEEKKKFAVCVKGLDFPEDDLSIKMTEWIEVLGALGADKIFLYNLEVHPNISKVRILVIILLTL